MSARHRISLPSRPPERPAAVIVRRETGKSPEELEPTTHDGTQTGAQQTGGAR